VIADNCACGLSGNVLEFHDDEPSPGHPEGQHVMIYSPPADKSALSPSINHIFAEYDIYADLPLANGVLYRPGWSFYPYICPQTGESIWSTRVDRSQFYLVPEPGCSREVESATSFGVPADCDLISLVYEV